MIKRHLFRAALCNIMLLSASSAFANGDPVAIYSAISLSPTPVAVHIPEVQLEDEYVTFTPRDRYMDVYVRYLLHNKSDRAFKKLAYGFPIDYLGSGPAKWKDIDEISESQEEIGWRDNYIREVTFTLNECQISWQCSRDSIIVPAEKQYSFLIEDEVRHDSAGTYSKRVEDSLYAIHKESMYIYTNPVLRRWYYSYLDIPAQSYAVLEVRYSVECNMSIGLYRRSSHLLGYRFDYMGGMRFQYDFTPAAYWGDGHANHFSVMLDASKITNADHFNRQKKLIQGLPMYEKDKRWYYETQRFNLAASKPFIVDYYLTRPPHQPLDRLLNHCIPSTEYTIEVSGAESKYPATNLSDLNPSTTTVLRPNSNDSIFITIRFHKPTIVEGMLLFNGYTKNADTYRNNTCIDSLFVLANRFTIGNWNGKEVRNDYEDDIIFGSYEHIKFKRVFYPEQYSGRTPASFDWQSLVDNAMLLNLNKYGQEAYCTEIRIVITATTKGLKYDDLCVSEILLIAP